MAAGVLSGGGVIRAFQLNESRDEVRSAGFEERWCSRHGFRLVLAPLRDEVWRPALVRGKAAARATGTGMLALALALMVSGCGTPPARNVTVMTRAFRYEPSSFEWRVGQPVRLQLRNPDAVEHDFVVDGLKFSMTGGGTAHGAHASAGSAAPAPRPDSLHVHADAFAETGVTFTPLSKGSYTVYCTIPGHKEAGMTAQLVVS